MRAVFSIFCLFFLLSFSAKATHIVGGELNYKYLGNNNYEISLTVFRDCKNGQAPFDSPAALGIFNSNNTLVQTIFLPFTGSDTLKPRLTSPCLDPSVSVCYEWTTYIDTINLPPLPGGYQLAYQRCCRNGTIQNIVDPGATGMTYYTSIPDTTIATENSNPVFKDLPPIFICSELPFTFDHSAIDADGDSLVYELFQPYTGATQANPRPQPPWNPPYTDLVWQTPYSTADMLGGAEPLRIDSITGMLTAIPKDLGQFVVGIKVLEYRNGVLLSETRRDVQFNVEPCDKLAIAAAVAPNYSCHSFNVDFENKSYGDIGSFLWNFGDTSTLADTSQATTPSYTYPDTGTYSVQLIAYSTNSIGCNDTTTVMVRIIPEFVQEVKIEPTPCTQEMNFEVSTNLDSTGGIEFSWDFGDGTPPSEMRNTKHTYATPGNYTIRIGSNYPDHKGCRDGGEYTIEVLPAFAVNSEIIELPCSPDINFRASSSYDALFPINYRWDFGLALLDSDTSTLLNGAFTYPEPGSYVVGLTVQVDSPACSAMRFIPVEIYPDLTFAYHVIEDECSYQTEFMSSSSLDDLVETNYRWSFGDGNQSRSKNVSHRYGGSGNYEVKLLINSSNGCADSTSIELEKTALNEVFIPNAFTPNGDGNNDVLLVRGDFDEMSLKIYNRWGEKVFESNNSSIGWDGNYQGKAVNADVFVYQLTTFCGGEESNIQEGNITLIR